ncbi:DsbA family protein [Microbacterium phyllosphaerae]|uniref:DsbA family protein n=1 Tax=Microbacterium phyllosphaerae TaxID=124798 RepID=UPI00216AAAAE|nr:thioredoxin domain-containing protein [Microbacterium phyllosphaerae]MCS3442187.1 protein-disulfide isomerase [Microbacterium phyllosphaerae]
MRSHFRSAGAAMLAAALSLTLASCATTPPDAKTAAPAISRLSGTEGTVNAESGFIELGDGATVIDLYVDAMCPYCRMFEDAHADFLFREVADGRATLRLHPVAILNRYSQGTDYSTRAAASLVAVAQRAPDAVQGYLAALFDAQPDEGTAGLTDEELADLAASVGVDIRSDDGLSVQKQWVDQVTYVATTGPLSDSVPHLQHVPTTLINGELWEGNSSEVERFRLFYEDSRDS